MSIVVGDIVVTTVELFQEFLVVASIGDCGVPLAVVIEFARMVFVESGVPRKDK